MEIKVRRVKEKDLNREVITVNYVDEKGEDIMGQVIMMRYKNLKKRKWFDWLVKFNSFDGNVKEFEVEEKLLRHALKYIKQIS